jgi:hypothetical protein
MRDFGALLRKGDLASAGDLRKALEQVARLTPDEPLHGELASWIAYHEHLQGRREQALVFQRRAFQGQLANPAAVGTEQLSQGMNLAVALNENGYRLEAQCIAAFCEALTRRRDLAAHRPFARVVRTMLEIDGGRIRRRLGELTEQFAKMARPQRIRLSGALLKALFVGGAARADGARGIGLAGTSRLWQQMRIAFWQGRPVAMKHALAARRRVQGAIPKDPPMVELLEAGIEALDGRKPALNKLREEVLIPAFAAAPTPRERFSGAVLAAQAACLGGVDLRDMHARAKSALGDMPPQCTPDILDLSLFHRHALLIDRADQRAREYFAKMKRRGYMGLCTNLPKRT